MDGRITAWEMVFETLCQVHPGFIKSEKPAANAAVDAIRDLAAAAKAPPPQPAQAEEDAYVIERMGKLLAEIAIIVNGPEPPLTRWSYHDLPAKVRQIKERSDSSLGPEVARVVYEQVNEGTWRWYVNWIDNNLPNGTLLFAQRPAVESEAQGG
jgi:hypothetical protein